MSPITHLLLSWSAASTFAFNKKDRALVTVAGVAPDMDGLGLLWDLTSYQTGQPLALWIRFHHVLGHNITFGVILAMGTFMLATRRVAASVGVLCIFHLHLFCDLLGARAPDEFWSIPYLLPFSHSWNFVWSKQWPLNSWQNFVITFGAITFVFYQGRKRGISPLELVSQRANDSFVSAIRARFGSPYKKRDYPGSELS